MDTKNSTKLRGAEREATLDLRAYFSDSYFALPQLFSLSHQIEKIHKLAPRDIIEIGIGNGFTSSFLRRAGYDVVTVDINPALGPDICAPLAEVEPHLYGRRFDLAVCCEVLEHMPFAEFESNIKLLRRVADRLFLTLPNNRKYFGFSGLVRFPKYNPIEVKVFISGRFGKGVPKEHFWEVDSCQETSLKNITSILGTVFSSVKTGNFSMNPYHRYFIAY